MAREWFPGHERIVRTRTDDELKPIEKEHEMNEDKLVPYNEPEKAEVEAEEGDPMDALDDSVFDFDMPDIPMPEEIADAPTIEDKFKSAFKFSFLGIGRGGSRLVEMFNKLGYNRCCIVNTAKQDLDEIDLPDKNKLWLGAGGAGGQRRQGAHHVKEHYEEIVDLMCNSYGPDFDRIMICVSAGGGTGSGGLEIAVDIANAVTESLRIKKAGEATRVGLMIALPHNSERSYMLNSCMALKFVEEKLKNKELSPVIIIDNERISQLHPGATIGDVWTKINQSAVTMLHLFNVISVSKTKHIALDPADLGSILDSGVVTYGATPIGGTNKEALGQAMRDNVKKNVLCGGADLRQSSIAGCILAGRADVVESLSAKAVDHGFEMLERLIKPGGVVHRGIYTTNKPLSAYTIIGGLGLPKDRLDEIARLAGRVDWDE